MLKKNLYLAICFFFLSFSIARAEFVSPEKLSVHTEKYVPLIVDIPQGSFFYGIKWQGISVAEATITVSKLTENAKDYWDIKVSATSSSIVAIFYSLEFTGHGVFSTSDLRPKLFRTKQIENGRESERMIDFHEDGTIEATRTKRGKIVEKLAFNPNNLLFDPISGAFFVRSLDLSIGHKVDVDIYNSRHRYIITFLPDKIENITVAKQKYQAINIVPAVQLLTDTEPEKRVRRLNVWVSNDPQRLILRFASDVWIGKVTADLIRYLPK